MSPNGVELFDGPDSQGERKMEIFLTGKVCTPPLSTQGSKERTPPPQGKERNPPSLPPFLAFFTVFYNRL